MRQAEWHCFPERYNHGKNKRLDVVAYHKAYSDNFFAFELKIPKSTKDLTKALRQMIDYRKQKNWTYPIKFFCLFTLHDEGFIHTRYFWRFGFGVGNLDTMTVQFNNGEAKSTIDLLNPNYACYFSLSEQIHHILKRVTDGWDSYDDES